MRVGLLSDAHGNPVGLAACLTALDRLGVQQLYFLGDAVGYFPGDREVLELLSRRSVVCQQGNHEAMLLRGAADAAEEPLVYGFAEARRRLRKDELNRLADWPIRREVVLGRRRLLLVHGTPDSPLEGRCYPDSDRSQFDSLPYDAIFLGHTHRPFIHQSGTRLVVNVGSCGMPRDQGNAPAFAVYDDEAHSAEILRVRIDSDAVLQRFGDAAISEQVREVLFRRSDRPLVGRLLQP